MGTKCPSTYIDGFFGKTLFVFENIFLRFRLPSFHRPDLVIELLHYLLFKARDIALGYAQPVGDLLLGELSAAL